MEIRVNEEVWKIDVEPEMPLLWVLRDVLGRPGTKFGCGVAYCGACTVLIDDQPMKSCVVPVASVKGKIVRTIEGLKDGHRYQRVQAAWLEHQVPQCGYCQPGQIMAAIGLLSQNPDPSDAEIDAAISNVCRCGTYSRIRAAIHAAAKS